MYYRKARYSKKLDSRVLSLINISLDSISIIPSNKKLKEQLEFIRELLEKFPDENKINKV